MDERGFLAGLQREFNGLSDEEKSVRRRSLRAIESAFGCPRDPESPDPPRGPSSQDAASEVVADPLRAARPLLRALDDSAESVREGAARCLLALVATAHNSTGKGDGETPGGGAADGGAAGADTPAVENAPAAVVRALLPLAAPVIAQRVCSIAGRAPVETTEEVRLALVRFCASLVAVYAASEDLDAAPQPSAESFLAGAGGAMATVVPLSASAMTSSERGVGPAALASHPRASAQDPPAVAAQISELTQIACAALTDAFPECRKAGATLTSLLSRVCPRSSAQHAEAMCDAVVDGPLAHQQYKVRLAGVRSLAGLVIRGASGRVETLGATLSNMSLDRNGSVRAAAVETASAWLAGPEREVYDALALPAVVRGLSDPADNVVAAAAVQLDALGALQERDYEDDIRKAHAGRESEGTGDGADFGIPRDRETATAAIVARSRPRLGARMVIRKRLHRIIPDVIASAAKWGGKTRALACLRDVVLHAEEHCTAQLSELLTALTKAARDDDAEVRVAAVAVAGEIGLHLDPAVFLPAVLPAAGIDPPAELHGPAIGEDLAVGDSSSSSSSSSSSFTAAAAGSAPGASSSSSSTSSSSSPATNTAAAAAGCDVAAALVGGCAADRIAPFCPRAIETISRRVAWTGAPLDTALASSLAKLVAALARATVHGRTASPAVELHVAHLYVAFRTVAAAVASTATGAEAVRLAAHDAPATAADISRSAAEVLAMGDGGASGAADDDAATMDTSGGGDGDGDAYSPAGSVDRLIARHAEPLLQLVLRGSESWGGAASSFAPFASLVSALGPSASRCAPRIAPAVAAMVDIKRDPELRSRAMALLATLLSQDGTAAAFAGIGVQVAVTCLVPSLVWRAGKPAAAVRRDALDGLNALVESGAITDDGIAGKDGGAPEIADASTAAGWSAVLPDLFPVLISCLDDDSVEVRTRAYATVAKLARRAPRQFDEERVWRLQDPLLKALDDSSDAARVVLCDAIAAYSTVIPRTYTQGSFDRLASDLALHVDDASEKVRQAVAAAARALGAHSKPASLSVAEKFNGAAPKMRNFDGASALADEVVALHS